MTTEAKVQLTSTELGSLWMTYESTSASIVMFDVIKNNTIDQEARNILSSYITESQNIKNQIINVFNNEKVVIPMGFDERVF